MLGIFTETFGLGRGAGIAATALILLTVASAAYLFFQSAPPKTLVITCGPPGSVFERYALSYSNTLARDHVHVKVVSSRGTEENLSRLRLGGSRFDVGFVQGGLAGSVQPEGRRRVLNSLGSIMYEPLWVFCRLTNSAVLLSDFAGQRLAIGKGGLNRLAQPTQLLLAKARLRRQTQAQAELGVIAPVFMGVQRQVVGQQVDIVRQQQR